MPPAVTLIELCDLANRVLTNGSGNTATILGSLTERSGILAAQAAEVDLPGPAQPPEKRPASGCPNSRASASTPTTRSVAIWTCGSGRSLFGPRTAGRGSSRSATRLPAPSTATFASAPGTRRRIRMRRAHRVLAISREPRQGAPCALTRRPCGRRAGIARSAGTASTPRKFGSGGRSATCGRRPAGGNLFGDRGSLSGHQAPRAVLTDEDMGVPAVRGHPVRAEVHDHPGPPDYHAGRVAAAH